MAGNRLIPNSADAHRKPRPRVLCPDGTIGVLLFVDHATGEAVVRHVYSRYDLILIDHEGDERDERDRLRVCGPCGAIDGDHGPECIRAGGRPTPHAASGAPVATETTR